MELVNTQEFWISWIIVGAFFVIGIIYFIKQVSGTSCIFY
jgi:hypothetical protein